MSIRIMPWPWVFRFWRLAIGRRRDIPNRAEWFTDSIHDTSGTWDHLVWRLYWLRRRTP